MARGLRQDIDVIETVGLIVGRIVVHVRPKEAVLIANFVIHSRGQEISRSSSHSGKSEDTFVPVDRAVGMRKESQVLRDKWIHIDVTSREVPSPRRVRRDDCGRADDSLRLAYPFVVAEDEGPVLPDRASGRSAELIALVGRFPLVTGIR